MVLITQDRLQPMLFGRQERTEKMKKTLVFAIVAGVMWISLADVRAVNYYVCDTGADCNAGAGSGWSTGSATNNGLSKSSPFKTIQQAADIVSAGDIVIVGDGVYTNEGYSGYNVRMKAAGTEANPIIFRSENMHGARLSGSGNHDRSIILITTELNWIRFEGLWLDAGQTGLRANPEIAGVNNITLYQVKITDMYCLGVMTGSYARNFTIDRCLFYEIGDPTNPCHSTEGGHPWVHEHGYYAQGSGHIIQNSIFYNMGAGWAIKIDGHLGTIGVTESTHKIINNVFAHAYNPFNYNPDHGGHITFYSNYTGHGGLIQSNPQYVIIDNNVFFRPPVNTGDNHAIRYSSTCDSTVGTQIIRNCVTDADYFIYFSGVSDITDLGTYSQVLDGTTTPAILNHPDLGMTDPENNDFTLTSSATYLIDKGIADNAPDEDFAGTPRPYGGGYDIGAYEFPAAHLLQIPQANWSLEYFDSEEPEQNGYAVNSFDGDPDTFWSTAWYEIDPDPCCPHEIQIDLGDYYDVCGFRYLPRQDSGAGSENGMIKDYEFYVSNNTDDWGTAVASGSWTAGKAEKQVSFDRVLGQYVRLVALSEVNDGLWTSMAELNVLAVQPDTDINNDGKVNIEDFAVLADWWDDDGGCVEPGWCGGSDFNMSGTVDFNDLAYFVENWLRQTW
jgi:F5/8 type C domain-containing protein